MSKNIVSRVCAILAAVAASGGVPVVDALEMSTFSAEVTAPMGHALMGGGIAPAKSVVDPLYANGLVLLGAGDPIVMVAMDWCEIRNDAYDAFRDALAEAAGTTRERVLLTSVHQHDTPVADFTAQRLLDEHGLPEALCKVPYVKDCIARVARALKDSLGRAVPVTHYGIGEAAVEGVASNRRVVAADGTVSFPRNSATADAAIRDAPIGEHDPMLKTLSFWNGDQALAALNFYSVHPMSYYGKGGVSADFVGMARRKRQEDDPAIHQFYFTGCSGDTTAGKYNDGAIQNRPVLADRIYQAMVAAWNATEKHEIGDVTVRVAKMTLEPKSTAGYSEEEMKAILADTNAKTFTRILAAMGLSFRMRLNQPIDVPAVDFGKAQFLVMPAESFVGYQLMAQQLRPDSFVVTAGFGECAPGYIPTAQTSAEGFNDAHDWCWVAPGAEDRMRAAMAEALGAPGQ
ncbi:MAG: hypothetical protein IT365_22700 [Candidatus Hydrogenedentes bacterium]|nr:hypothetical protein [Candidatus Hydrogenedentota bacterium]